MALAAHHVDRQAADSDATRPGGCGRAGGGGLAGRGRCGRCGRPGISDAGPRASWLVGTGPRARRPMAAAGLSPDRPSAQSLTGQVVGGSVGRGGVIFGAAVRRRKSRPAAQRFWPDRGWWQHPAATTGRRPRRIGRSAARWSAGDSRWRRGINIGQSDPAVARVSEAPVPGRSRSDASDTAGCELKIWAVVADTSDGRVEGHTGGQ